MKFLVDQQLHAPSRGGSKRKVTKHFTFATSAWNMPDDRDLWREARSRGAVIISKDEDFSVIVRVRDGPQVVWVRLGNCSNERLIQRMSDSWASVIDELSGGALLIEVR